MAFQNVERRIEKLEGLLRVGAKAKTVEEMFDAFERGDYGPRTLMDVVSGALATSDLEAFFDSLRKDLPWPLVDHFKDRIGQSEGSAA
jgi:hypothetical protein